MNSRMDKYNNDYNDNIPKRSEKNKNLYTQVYAAYDEFENLVVPSNSMEIDPKKLNKYIKNGSEFHKSREYIDSENIDNNKIARKEKVQEQQIKENEIYDIKELLNKAVESNKKGDSMQLKFTNDDYLKKLNLNSDKTNIEQVKELYEEIKDEMNDEEETLLKTANLSLEILSDLKSDNDETFVSPPIKDEEIPIEAADNDFYSNTYKFSKKDFEDKKYEENTNFSDDEDEGDSNSNLKLFVKILLIIFGMSLVIIILIYLFNYLNKI